MALDRKQPIWTCEFTTSLGGSTFNQTFVSNRKEWFSGTCVSLIVEANVTCKRQKSVGNVTECPFNFPELPSMGSKTKQRC